MNCRRLAIGSLCCVLGCAGSTYANARLNAGAWEWRAAAKSGRAGVFFLGDSIVNHGQGGWTSGLAQAAKGGIGLSGSSLLIGPVDSPTTWSNYAGARLWTNSFSDSAVTGIPSLSPLGRYLDVRSNFTFLGSGVDPVTLDLSGPVDWHVLATSTSPVSRLGAIRINHVGSAGNPVQALASQPINNPDGLTETVFHFGVSPPPGDFQSFIFTTDSRDAALQYTRLTLPDKTGISISGWGFAGGTAESFRSDYYNHPRFTTNGRDALYRSLTAGDSGKLNVVIAFGVNDARTQTPQQFGASVSALVADVRRDWQHSGLALEDLSFTLLSTYQIDQGAIASVAWYRLVDNRAVLDTIASQDPQISFIDMWEDGPDWRTAVAKGYLSDGIHPTALGTQAYGEALMSLLDPTAGDANIDNRVDFADLLIITQNFGLSQGATWVNGDFNEDGRVDFADLLLLTQHYTPMTSIEADMAVARSLVPEPSLALLLSLTLRRRRG